jgi:DNA-3-methyladenine glycosylase II
LSPPIKKLDQHNFSIGVAYLCDVDPDLANVIRMKGYPALGNREPGFLTLMQIILEQQVSLASAKAAYLKLVNAVDLLTPERFLDFSDEELLQFGFSRQKTRYGRALSREILDGDLDLKELENLEDVSVRTELMKIKGIGPWTADIYLLMALQRPDIWPKGDLALIKAVWKIKKRTGKPSVEKVAEIAGSWRPWRSVAARIAWHDYLS